MRKDCDYIFDHLREQEFEEQELKDEIESLMDVNCEDAANTAIAQEFGRRRIQREKKNGRIDKEYDNRVQRILNEVRRQIKLERANNMYKQNRKKKKNKNAARLQYLANKKKMQELYGMDTTFGKKIVEPTKTSNDTEHTS